VTVFKSTNPVGTLVRVALCIIYVILGVKLLRITTSELIDPGLGIPEVFNSRSSMVDTLMSFYGMEVVER
jgi:hypothetical protein